MKFGSNKMLVMLKCFYTVVKKDNVKIILSKIGMQN